MLDTNYFYIVINPVKNVKSIMKSNVKTMLQFTKLSER